MIKQRSFITGIKSFNLSSKEKKFLNEYKPWGVILFSRNIKSIKQTKRLTDQIKNIFKNNKYPILIDQEGGRVNRLKKITNIKPLTNEYFGKLYSKDKKKFNRYYKEFIKQTSNLLRLIGVNINTVPVLDVIRKNTSKILENRSFSKNPNVVKKLGQACIKQYEINKLGTVIKHIPGHGCASIDSHLNLPKVNLSYKNLEKKRFFTI